MQFFTKKTIFVVILMALAASGIYLVTRAGKVAPKQTVTSDPLANIVIPEKYSSDQTTRQMMEKRIDQVRKLYHDKPNIWETWIAIGNIKADIAEDYAGAIEAYKKSLSITPNNILAYRNIAEMYNQHLHDYDKAATYYRLAINNKFDDYEMYIALAQIQHNRLNQNDEAEKTLLDGLKHTGNKPEIWVQLIYLYRDTKNTAKYKSSAKELLKAYPKNARYQETFADALR